MEIQTTSETERRIAGNVEVLSELEAEIVSLEKSIVELGSLEAEKDRLCTAVQTLTEEEARILGDDGSGSESALVKRLGELRTRRDVQSARLTSINERIEAQKADLANQGAAVRKAFATVIAQLWTARQQRVTTTLNDLFGSPFIQLRIGRAELRELVDQTVLMKKLKDSRNRVVLTIGDPVQELEALRLRPRAWLAEVTDLVTNEPGLTLKNFPAKQQPIEQPAREMAAV
jgi:DNA repair exonuclease SbcCD ATPase subunit